MSPVRFWPSAPVSEFNSARVCLPSNRSDGQPDGHGTRRSYDGTPRTIADASANVDKPRDRHQRVDGGRHGPLVREHIQVRLRLGVNVQVGGVPALYFRSGAWYEVGHVVAPGNWGRVINAFGPRHTHFYREYVFEKIRHLEFPDRPSRMRAAFAFESQQVAASFNQPQAPLLYVVQLQDRNGTTFRTDMGWVDAMQECHTFEDVESHARNYWKGNHKTGAWEILALCGLVIIRRIP